MALTVQGSNAASGTSVTIPTHAVGDIIVIFAQRVNTSTSTLPSVPSAAGTVPAWTSIDTSSSSRSPTRLSYFVATATNHTSGTWTNAQNMIAVVLRGQAASPIGGHAINASNFTANICTAPAITLSDSSGTSVILEFYGWGDATSSFTSISTAPTGYTQQVKSETAGSTGNGCCLNTKDVTTSDGTKDQVSVSSCWWRGATLEILAAASQTLTPATATVAVTGGTPVVTATDNHSVAPTTATITVTGGTPDLGGNNTVAPATASVAVAGGTPTIGQTVNPLTGTITVAGGTPVIANGGPTAPLLAKLAAGQNVTIQIIGDSTAWGPTDVTATASNYGWPGQLFTELGARYDATVVINLWNYPSTGYLAGDTIRTGSGPTITVQLGGIPGGKISTYTANQVALLPLTSCDLIYLQDGFNETSTGFTTGYLAFIDIVRGYAGYVGVPIISTTANATTATSISGHPSFASLFGALSTALVGSSLPLSPALQKSSARDLLWLEDTKQVGATSGELFADGLHPLLPLYRKQALFMLSDSYGVNISEPAGATVAVTGGTPSLGATVAPTTGTIHVTGGTPDIGGGNTLSPATATALVTGGTPDVSATDHHTVTPTTANVTITGGTPGVTASDHHTASPTTGTVTITGGTPEVDVSEPADTEPQAGSMTITVTPTATMTLEILP